MNNDADQKPKWREWWINFDTTHGVAVRTRSQYEDKTFPRCPDYQSDAVHVIEAAPALAGIESLRAENAELKSETAGLKMALKMACEHAQEKIDELKKDKSIRRCGECGNVGMSSAGIGYISDLDSELTKTKDKLSAATAQLENMAEALRYYQTKGIIDNVRDEILKDFENEKKSSALQDMGKHETKVF